jgi:hypothetical protein
LPSGSTTRPNGVSFFNAAVVAENHDTDVVGFEVQRHAAGAIGEFDHLAGLDVVEPVNTGDTVTNGKDLADLRNFGFASEVGDLLLEN